MIVLSVAPLIQNLEASNLISLTLVDIGHNITFDCNVSGKDLKFVYWYKQSLGYMIETVASVILGQVTIRKGFNGSHFSIRAEGSRYDLTIYNVSKEDEATYLCQTGTTYSQKFINGSFLAVNDHNHHKSLDLKQHPKVELVQQGETVILQCSLPSKNKEKAKCPNKPWVYWFRTESDQFLPGIIYTQWNISDKDLERSCFYSLSVRDSSDSGIYYSTVVACGSILIGEGSKVETRQQDDGFVITLGALLVCCVIVLVVLSFYIKQKRSEQNKDQKSGPSLVENAKSRVGRSKNSDGEAMELNYASVQRFRRTNQKREKPPDCVYSAVRQHGHQDLLSVP